MTQSSDHDPRPTDDSFTVRRLRRELDAERAINDVTWEDGYRSGLFDKNADIPEELTAALRCGSAQQHVAIPVDNDHVTVVLARDGTCQPRWRSEARTWETIRHLYRNLAEGERRNPGVDRIRRQDLPEAVAAIIWRSVGGRLTVVVNRSADRSSLRGLGSRAIRSGGSVLAVLLGWVVWKETVRAATPFVAATAMVATAAMVLVPNSNDADQTTSPPSATASPLRPGLASQPPGQPSPTPTSTPSISQTPAAVAGPLPPISVVPPLNPQPAPSGLVSLSPSVPPPAIPTPDPLAPPTKPAKKTPKPKHHRPARPKNHGHRAGLLPTLTTVLRLG